MALTLEADQRLESVGLVALFDDNKTMWLEAAKETKAFMLIRLTPKDTKGSE